MDERCYFLVKTADNQKETIIIDYQRSDGFRVKPRNNVKYDGITVNQMVIIKPSFIEKVLKRKVKRKLDLYLQFIINLLESDDEEADATSLAGALDDLSRYRSIVNNKYRNFLEEKYINLLLKKISLLEQEIKKRLQKQTIRKYYEKDLEKTEEKERKGR